MDAEKIMSKLMGTVENTHPEIATDDDMKKAVDTLANMVVMYNAALKSQGVGYFARRSLLIAFQTQTLGTALLMHS